MVNFPGRDRRRRVLKDEVLSASTNHRSLRATVDADASNDVPRYSDAAGVENHPQVTDFVPRRFRSIAIFVLLGIGLTAMLTALDYFTLPIAAASGMQTTATLDITSSGSLAAWFSAVVLLIASATCLLTYSIRRHRIDDFQGRYRVWLGASFACLVMSANSVAGLHQILADVLGHVTGWTALHGAVWWLVLPGVPMGWILVRAVFDMRECRLGAVLLVAAMASYAASMVSVLGFARPRSAVAIARCRGGATVRPLADARFAGVIRSLRRPRCSRPDYGSSPHNRQTRGEDGLRQAVFGSGIRGRRKYRIVPGRDPSSGAATR